MRRVEPVLALLGQCVRVGGLGAAQVAHACRQLVSAATAIGMSEATMIAERAGLDVAALDLLRADADAGHALPISRPACCWRRCSVAADAADRGGVQASLVDQLRRLGRSGRRPLGSTTRISVRRTGSWPPSSSQVSCRITITKTMITRMPMIVPISPRFIVPPLLTGSLQATT